MFNIEILYKVINIIVEVFDHYSSMVSEAKLKATKVTGRKILIPKEMLERLPIGLAQVKVDNNYRSV